MERFKRNYVIFPLYLKAFKYNWDVMANEISKIRAKDPNGLLDLKELDKRIPK
jgi:hypothetical protein